VRPPPSQPPTAGLLRWPVSELPSVLTELVFDSLSTADLATLIDREEKSSDRSSSSSSSSAPAASAPYLTPDLARAFGGWRDRCKLTCGQVWRAVLAERLRLASAHRVAQKERKTETPTTHVSEPGVATERSQSLCERLCAIDARRFYALLAPGDGDASFAKRYTSGDSVDFQFRALDAKRSVLGVPAIFSCRVSRAEVPRHGGRDPATLRLRVTAEIGQRLLETRANVWDAKAQKWSGDLEAERIGAPTGAEEYRRALRREFSAPQSTAERRAVRRARSAWRTFMDQDVGQTIVDVVGGGLWAAKHSESKDELATVFIGRADDPRTLIAFARILAAVRWAAAQSVFLRAWQGHWQPTKVYLRQLRALRLAFGDALPLELEYTLDNEASVAVDRDVAARIATLGRLAAEQGAAFTVATQIRFAELVEDEEDDDDGVPETDEEDEEDGDDE
jgi:hypothetical protein